MKKVYQFSFVSHSDRCRGVKTFDTVADAQRERTRLHSKGYKVGILQTIDSLSDYLSEQASLARY